MNLTLKQLIVFMSIIRHGNLSAAAEALHMTKGALSQTLSSLEQHLGTRLFDRRHTRLYVNQAGMNLIPLADELLSRAKYLEEKFSQSTTPPAIKVGCTKSIGSFMLPGILSEFKRKVGWLPEVITENIHAIHGKLNRFDIDIALLEGPVVDYSQQSQLWMQDEMVVVASRSHPLAGVNTVSYKQLSQEKWILRETESASRRFFENQLAMKLENSQIAISLNSFDTILSCVHHQLGITFISRTCMDNPFYGPHLVQLPLEDVFFRNLYIVFQNEKYLSPPILEWINFLQSLAAKKQPPKGQMVL
ncbi:TPA: LysR family transcriptional regulator [Klebsiella aerogenes]